jgi:hypothetical protein
MKKNGFGASICAMAGVTLIAVSESLDDLAEQLRQDHQML